jgi:glutathione S-transferase
MSSILPALPHTAHNVDPLGAGVTTQSGGFTMMKLMYSQTSPYVRRVRAAASELGLSERLQLEPITVAPVRENATYAERVNPLRKIPALVLDDAETVLVESAVICQYLDELAGGGKLIPREGMERWRVLSQQAIAQGMTDALVLARYETALRPEPLRWGEWVTDQQDRFWSGIAWFERRAPTALPGARIDISQLALACCLGYAEFRFAELDWPARAPQVNAWYRKIAERPSLKRTDPRVEA